MGVEYFCQRIYVKDYADAKIGCVPVAFHFLCHTHSPVLWWQVLGCAIGTHPIFRFAYMLTQMCQRPPVVVLMSLKGSK